MCLKVCVMKGQCEGQPKFEGMHEIVHIGEQTNVGAMMAASEGKTPQHIQACSQCLSICLCGCLSHRSHGRHPVFDVSHLFASENFPHKHTHGVHVRGW